MPPGGNVVLLYLPAWFRGRSDHPPLNLGTKPEPTLRRTRR